MRVSSLRLFFGFTLFASSALLFLVQPMFAKMALPLLGGSPGVWNTCVVFFQAALLCGYGYAHLLTRLPLAAQVGLHAVVLAVAAWMLPITIPADWQPPSDGTPIPWLLGVLSARLGVLFVAASASAPLLQRWLSMSGRTAKSGADPYRLYAASNLGSLASLLSYPFLVEPEWTLAVQSRLWAWGFGLVGTLIVVCGVITWRSQAAAATVAPLRALDHAEDGEVSWGQRAWWVALAAVPSSLMLSVTTYLSTDIAAMPLLWILPLTGYLLSFVVAFGPRAMTGRQVPARLVPVLVCSLALFLVQDAALPLAFTIGLHLLSFCAIAAALHIELADRRPAAGHLTEYYFWLSAGGVLGGLFNGIVAPLVFTTVAEYPIGLVLASLLLPRMGGTPRTRPQGWVSPALMGALVWAGTSWSASTSWDPRLRILLLAPIVVWALSFSRQRTRFAVAIACCFIGGELGKDRQRILLQERSFFGTYRVERDARGASRTLWHGTTLHGEQRIGSGGHPEPLTYYHPTGPVGQALTALLRDRPQARVAAVGLGAGSLAAYAQSGQEWTFFEIDPLVEAIARNSRFFTYLDQCRGSCRVVLGDARQSLARAGGERFDVIVLDAFSSDAIPVHLLTREAMDLYLSRLEPGGVLAFHISNRHLALGPVLGALFADRGLVGLAQTHVVAQPDPVGRSSSEWVLAARSRDDLTRLPRKPHWNPVAAPTGVRVWSDQYSDIVSVLKSPLRQ